MPNNPPKDQINYCGYVVAIFDVLGQKDAIRALGRIEPDLKSSDSLIESLKDSAGVVRSIRKAFVNFFETFNKPTDPREGITLTAEQQQTFDRFRTTELKTYQFSDMFIAFVPIINNNRDWAMRDVFAVFAACAMIMQFSIAGKHPVRGAVDLGWGMEIEDGEIYGPAFLSAFELQEFVAQHPRVIIGKKLFAALTQLASVRSTNIVETLIVQQAATCVKFVARDEDGSLAIDYLGAFAKEQFGRELVVDMYEKGRTFVEEEHIRFCDEGNWKLASRYAAVRRYYTIRGPPWRTESQK